MLDFYPKFGFNRVDEYQHSKIIIDFKNDVEVKKLDMAHDANRNLVINSIDTKKPISQLSMIKNSDLVMFYLTSFMADNVFYLEKFNAIVIAEYIGSLLYLKDIYSETDIELETII